MNDKRYSHLMRVRRTAYKIRKLTYRRDALEACLLPPAIRYDKDNVQTTPSDKISEIVAEINYIDKKIAELMADNLKAIQEVSEAIEQLDDDREKAVLSGYLLASKSMAAIASDIHYSREQTYRVYRKGLQKMTQMTQTTVI